MALDAQEVEEVAAPPDAMNNPERIIVRGTNWLGDSVITIPAVRALREIFPSSAIDMIVPAHLAGIWENDEAVNRVHSIPRPTPPREKTRIIRLLRRGRYGLGVIFPNSFESALWFFLGRVRSRVGRTGRGRSLLLTKALPRPRGGRHQVHHYLDLVRSLGEFSTGFVPSIRVPAGLRRWADGVIRDRGPGGTGPLIGVNPGAAYGEAKCWPRGRFAELIRTAQSRLGARAVIVGSEAERESAEALSAASGGRALAVAGETTIMQLAALAERCDVVVTNDSGPMHVACAVGTPVVAIFGPTDPAATGPLGRSIVVRKEVECGPCFARECPTDHHCMTSITAEEVFEAVEKMLDAGA